MPFQIHALAADPFSALCALTDAQLNALTAKRVIADSRPGFPCRVWLADAEVAITVSAFHHFI